MTSSGPSMSMNTSLPSSSFSTTTTTTTTPTTLSATTTTMHPSPLTSSSSSSSLSSSSSATAAMTTLLSLPTSEQQEFLEHLLRMRPPTAAAAAAAAESARLLPDGGAAGGSRVTLYKTKNKLQQLEDILVESHLLDNSTCFQSHAALEPAAVAAIFGDICDSNLGDENLSKNKPKESFTLDHDTDNEVDKSQNDLHTNHLESMSKKEKARVDMQENNLNDTENGKANEINIDCIGKNGYKGSVKRSIPKALVDSKNKNDSNELLHLRDCWSSLRQDLSWFYREVLLCKEISTEMTVKLSCMASNVRELCTKDPEQLFLFLERVVKEFLLDMKRRLIELLQNKSDDLAQNFIRETLLCYDRLCLAACELRPVLSCVELSYLDNFSLTWETVNKHLYEAIIHSDPLIQNHVPILISQLKALYADGSDTGDSCTSLLRHYLDVDVELEQVRSAWAKAGDLFVKYSEQQLTLKKQHEQRQELLKMHWASKLSEQEDPSHVEEEDTETLQTLECFEMDDNYFDDDNLSCLLRSVEQSGKSLEIPGLALWLRLKLLLDGSKSRSDDQELDFDQGVSSSEMNFRHDSSSPSSSFTNLGSKEKLIWDGYEEPSTFSISNLGDKSIDNEDYQDENMKKAITLFESAMHDSTTADRLQGDTFYSTLLKQMQSMSNEEAEKELSALPRMSTSNPFALPKGELKDLADTDFGSQLLKNFFLNAERTLGEETEQSQMDELSKEFLKALSGPLSKKIASSTSEPFLTTEPIPDDYVWSNFAFNFVQTLRKWGLSEDYIEKFSQDKQLMDELKVDVHKAMAPRITATPIAEPMVMRVTTEAAVTEALLEALREWGIEYVSQDKQLMDMLKADALKGWASGTRPELKPYRADYIFGDVPSNFTNLLRMWGYPDDVIEEFSQDKKFMDDLKVDVQKALVSKNPATIAADDLTPILYHDRLNNFLLVFAQTVIKWGFSKDDSKKFSQDKQFMDEFKEGVQKIKASRTVPTTNEPTTMMATDPSTTSMVTTATEQPDTTSPPNLTAVPKPTRPPAPVSTCTGVHVGGKKNSSRAKELNKLLQQHYCVHRKSKRNSNKSDDDNCNSGNAINPGSDLGHVEDDDMDHNEEQDEDNCEEEIENHDPSTVPTADKTSSSCSCCYCEVFGPATSSSAVVAPVSKKYPEMRERLRQLLKKKKSSNSNSSQKQIKTASKALQQTVASSKNVVVMKEESEVTKGDLKRSESTISRTISSSVSSTLSSSKSCMSNAARETTPLSTVEKSASVPVVTSTPKKEMESKHANPNCRKELVTQKTSTKSTASQSSHSSSSGQLSSVRRPSVDSVRSGQTSSTQSSRTSRTTNNECSKSKNSNCSGKYDVDAMLRFIEGQNEGRNEKKRAKKERQKNQRLEEQRRLEAEERRRREEEEKERKRREEEVRRQKEEEERMLKKQKKKAAQRAKKAAGKLDHENSLPSTSELLHQHHQTTLGYLEGLREQQMREIEALKQRHMAQIEEEQRKIRRMTGSNGASNVDSPLRQSGLNEEKNKTNDAMTTTTNTRKSKAGKDKTKVTSKPSTSSTTTSSSSQQIRIARTPDGGVTFTPLPLGAPTSNSFNSSYNMVPNATMNQPSQMNMSMSLGGMPSSNTPKVKVASNGKQGAQPEKPTQQPMVTIKRLPPSNSDGESTVTISMRDDAQSSKTSAPSSVSSSNEKLLYTLINGQVHKVNAPNHPDLIPGVLKTIDGSSESGKKSKKKKKTKRSKQEEGESSSHDIISGSPGTRNNFDLPTMMQAMALSSASSSSTPTLNAHGGNNSMSSWNKSNLPLRQDGKIDLSKLDLPPGISITKVQGPVPQRKYFPDPTLAPNSSMQPPPSQFSSPTLQPTLTPPSPSLPPPPPVASSCPGVRPASDVQLPAELQGVPDSNIIVVDTNALASEQNDADDSKSAFEDHSGGNNANTNVGLKSGPQVLIKNVNGKVSITPLPDPASSPSTSSASASTSKRRLAKKSRKKSQSGNPIDEDINRVFAPSENLDLENGDMDDDERVIEAFKRFCFNSVPLQQKTKVNFDVKNIAFKKK